MNILVVSANYGTSNSPSAVHAEDRVNSLREHGVYSHVLTESRLSGSRNVDGTRIERNPVKRIEQGIIDRVQKRHPLPFWRPDKFAHWDMVKRYEYALEKALSSRRFDVIYSTGGPSVVHIAVANVLDQFDIPWVAEIQDPLIFEGVDGPTYRASRRDKHFLNAAEEALKQAQALICVTESCAEHYRRKLRKKGVYCIYPGSSAPELRVKTAPETVDGDGGRALQMLYAGTLSDERSLGPLVKGIREIGIEEQLNVRVAGVIDGSNRRILSVLPFSQYDGILQRESVVEAIQKSDICLVIQNCSRISELTIPSKFYEYLSLSRPVLFLGYRNAEVRTLARTHNFYYCEQEDSEDVADTLRTLYHDFSTGQLRAPQEIRIEEAARQFLDICSTLIQKRRAAKISVT